MSKKKSTVLGRYVKINKYVHGNENTAIKLFYNFDRFLHYFEGIHLDIPEEAVTALAADFP